MECKNRRHGLVCRYRGEGEKVLTHEYKIEDEGQYTPFRTVVVCDCFELDSVESAKLTPMFKHPTL